MIGLERVLPFLVGTRTRQIVAQSEARDAPRSFTVAASGGYVNVALPL